MKINTRNSVFVFDLDDTLYKEIDYHASGIRSVADIIKFCFDIDVESYLFDKIEEGVTDLWGAVCYEFNLPESFKETLIWHYRLHNPAITLSSSVRTLLDFLETNSRGVAILTDGRIVSQKRKINALGLDNIPAYISESYGSLKPDLHRFRLIMEHWHSSEYIYVGDNPVKDFFAPNQLGWTSFGVRCNGHNIHSQDLSGLNESYLPHYWLSNLDELKEFLC